MFPFQLGQRKQSSIRSSDEIHLNSLNNPPRQYQVKKFIFKQNQEVVELADWQFWIYVKQHELKINPQTLYISEINAMI